MWQPLGLYGRRRRGGGGLARYAALGLIEFLISRYVDVDDNNDYDYDDDPNLLLRMRR